ncbi:MAG: symmetrical bis(5'-nucleosyl)-tetraphosphatase [Rhodocyclaceae bacterium]
MSTYAIGDIQGCFTALENLLGEIGFSPARDRLWLVGDLVNRGPQSVEVLRFVRSLGESAVTVLGNHDLHLVMLSEGYGRWHAEDTVAQVLEAPDRNELLGWLRGLPLFHHEDDYAMVHAGLLPAWDVPCAEDLAAELHEALVANEYRDLLAHLWGSEPAAWSDRLRGWERARVIVNAMTRMRFCTQDGVMEFRAKGPVGSAPPGFMPWFRVPGRASADHTVICGHWSALGLLLEERVFALDTGCLWGGSLTALRLEDRRVYQYRCAGQEPVGLERS